MTTTPTVWKAQHLLNPSADADLQIFLSLIDMGQGRHVGVYAEGGNYRGQIFDAEGAKVGGTFPVNVEQSSGASELFPLALASRPGGGFVAAYVVDGPANDGVFYDVYDVNGSLVDGGTIQASAAFNLTSPSIAIQENGSFLVTFVRENGDDTFDVVGRRVEANGSVGSELTIHDFGDTSATFAEAATLTNGNYVVVYQNFTTDQDIDFKIFGTADDPPAGQGPQVTPLSTDDDIDPQVAALTGGGFVVVWQDSNDGNGSGIMASVFNNSGGNVAGGTTGFQVNTATSGNQIAPDVVALKDGGFVVVWESSNAIKGQRFNAAGAKVGTEFVASPGATVISPAASKPAATLLGDGRFVVGFETFNGSLTEPFFDLQATIFDPREKTINGTSGADVLTSRIDGATVNGLGGADTLLGQGGPDTLNGGSGVDTMRGRGGDDTYIVDNVGDFPVENANQGKDLVLSSVSYSLVDNVENLTLTAAAVSGGGNGIANVLTGHGGLNRLDGFAGNDTLLGRGGNDFLFGGNNDDKLFGEAGGDDLEGNNGNDSLDGGTGADTMRGGGQNDTYVVDNAGDKAIESSGQGTDLVKASASFTLGANVENLTLTGGGAVNGTGNTLANIITGNGGANRINGGAGIDTLTGGAGPDTFVFDAAVTAKTVAAAADNADIVTDFNPVDDTIELAASAFPKLKVGVLKNKAFDSGSKKPAKDKHAVYYDEKNGGLWYDANGKKKGGKGDVLVATLDKGLDLAANDIVVA